MPRGLLGPGAHEILGPEAIKLGFRKPLVMTTGLRGSDTVHKIVESLKWHGLDVAVFSGIESNPKDYNVMDAVAMYQEEKCDSMISLGGGSAHDACKGARISIAHDGRNVNDFEGFNKSENPKNRRTSPCPRRRGPVRRRRGRTSSPTRRSTQAGRTSTSRSTTPRCRPSPSTIPSSTTTSRRTTPHSAASTSSRTP